MVASGKEAPGAAPPALTPAGNPPGTGPGGRLPLGRRDPPFRSFEGASMSSTNHPRTPLTGGRKRRHAMRAFKSKIKRVLWDSKRRKIVTIVSTIALVAATGAAAFFVLSVSGTASQDQTLGNSGNIALAGVRVTGFDANHMVPGDTTSIQVYASNPSGQTAQVSSIDYAVTSTAAGFDPAWFQVTPTSGLPVVMT